MCSGICLSFRLFPFVFFYFYCIVLQHGDRPYFIVYLSRGRIKAADSAKRLDRGDGGSVEDYPGGRFSCREDVSRAQVGAGGISGAFSEHNW